MSEALVSICLPTLDAIRFLEARIESIRRQSHPHWECIVGDSGSTDGTAERLQRWAAEDSRVSFHSIPREGLYAGWNECLRRARGEFVYIATADDTMHPRCLEESARALDAVPSAHWCHFNLDFIDEGGRPLAGRWQSLLGNQYYGRWLERPHLRSGARESARMRFLGSIYFSITELLFRRGECPPFPVDCGHAGDYFWAMEAVRPRTVLHLPRTLATWRVHPGQATAQDAPHLEEQLALRPEAFFAYPEAVAFRRYFQAMTARSGLVARVVFSLGNPWGRRWIRAALLGGKGSRVARVLRPWLPRDDLQPINLP